MSFDGSEQFDAEEFKAAAAAHFACFQEQVVFMERFALGFDPSAGHPETCFIDNGELERLVELHRNYLKVIESLRGVESVMHEAAVMAEAISESLPVDSLLPDEVKEKKAGQYRLVQAKLAATLPLIQQCGARGLSIINEAEAIYKNARTASEARESWRDN